MKLFVLYDGRAKFGDTDKASVYITATTEQEAIEDGKDSAFGDGIWYEYDIKNGHLVNEIRRDDIPPSNLNI